MSILRWVLPTVLLILFALLAIHSSLQKSATFDEGNHLVRGLYPLSGQGFLLNRDHPPLVNLLQALPVWFVFRPHVPAATRDLYPFFSYSEAVLWNIGNDGRRMIALARLVTLGLSVLLGLLVFVWARRLYGDTGGLVALTLYAFSPMVLAHGMLVTTDLGHAFGVFLFLFALFRLTDEASPRRILIAGLCLGLAIASKHIALLLVPLGFLQLYLAQATGRADFTYALGTFSITLARKGLVGRLMCVTLIWLLQLIVALCIVWGLYGFSVGRTNEFGIWPLAPDYCSGILRNLQNLKANQQFYLNGEISTQGWWTFFPLAFLYKTPLPILVLFLLTVGLHIGDKAQLGKGLDLVALTLGLYVICIISSRRNLGLRYLLPAYPVLFIYAEALARVPRWRLALVPLLTWLIIGTLAVYPDYLSYFNETIPSDKRHLYLVNSDLDWGQDLPALARYQKDHGIEVLRLGYFGTADPSAYGVVAENLPSYLRYSIHYNGSRTLDLTGVIAVSATLLQGLFNSPPGFYTPLRTLPPTADLGGSILVFDFRSQPAK